MCLWRGLGRPNTAETHLARLLLKRNTGRTDFRPSWSHGSPFRDLFWLSPSLGFLTHRKFLTYFPCSHTSTSPNLAQNERTGPCLEAPPNLRDHCYTRFSGSLHTFFSLSSPNPGIIATHGFLARPIPFLFLSSSLRVVFCLKIYSHRHVHA